MRVVEWREEQKKSGRDAANAVSGMKRRFVGRKVDGIVHSSLRHFVAPHASRVTYTHVYVAIDE